MIHKNISMINDGEQIRVDDVKVVESTISSKKRKQTERNYLGILKIREIEK